MNISKKELLESEEFETALLEGAECNKNIVTTYKEAKKSIYKQFQEVMYDSNDEIKEILAKRKKNRSESEQERLKQFKTDMTKTFNQVCDFIVSEDFDDPTKICKTVEKIAYSFAMLKYIGFNKLDDELRKYGIELNTNSMNNAFFNNENNRKCIAGIFEDAKNIKSKIKNDTLKINDDVFTRKVPIDLQYDKQNNSDGLKIGDFKKLVAMKTKILLAKTDADKEKVNEKIENAATEKQFESARAELVRDKCLNLTT